MSLFDFLTKITGSLGSDLLGFLDRIAIVAPDAAPEVAALKAKFSEAISVESLAAATAQIKQELEDIARGKLDPHDSPSDAI